MDWKAFIQEGSVTPLIEENARHVSFSEFSHEQCAEILSDLRGRLGGTTSLAHQRDRFRDIDSPFTDLLDALHYRESLFHGSSPFPYLEISRWSKAGRSLIHACKAMTRTGAPLPMLCGIRS